MILTAIDTETTGLIESHLMRLEFQPHVIQFCATVFDLDRGTVLENVDLLIQPPKLSLVTEDITKITRITQEMLSDKPKFAEVSREIFQVICDHPAVVAHNLSYDKAMIDLEARRLDTQVRWPLRQICTVEQSVHLLGYNTSLTDLHDKLFGFKFEGAHSARADVDALVKCAIEMRRRDML